jgi:hypothetical protein
LDGEERVAVTVAATALKDTASTIAHKRSREERFIGWSFAAAPYHRGRDALNNRRRR